MGPLYVSVNAGLICVRPMSNADAERGKLLGARLAVFDELATGEKLKTHEVQLLSGGDGIPARPLYKDPMTITPRHLCILSTNHMPELSEVIPAIMERLLCIHFPVTFTDLLPGEEPTATRRQADKGLKRRLEQNKAGVLRWLVEGAVAWYAAPGLRSSAPAKVRDFSTAYFAEQDKLVGFLASSCQTGDGLRVPTAEFARVYNEHLDSDGPVKDRDLGAAMRIKGFAKKTLRVNGINTKCFVGVALRDQQPTDAE